MSIALNVIKNGCLAVISFFVVYCILEVGSYFILNSITLVREAAHGQRLVITESFPAQLRLSQDEIMEDFPSISPIQRLGKHLSFDFDPVIGYRKLDVQQWYGVTIKEAKKKFVIVCFGGSTTQLDNWPKYLIDYAEEAGVKEDILVLNAGLAGYMTFTEKLYFSEWVLPMFENIGKPPDLILTLDGVNDIWYRILSYQLAKKEKAPTWYEQYHGYHQTLDSDIRRLATVSIGFRQFVSNMLFVGRQKAILIAPYTMRLLDFGARRVVNRGASIKQDNSTQTNQNIVQLPEEVEKRIVKSYRKSLVDFYGLANVRDIDFVAYLQPVVLETSYPHPLPAEFPFKGVNWFGLKQYRANHLFSNLYGGELVTTDTMFQMSEEVYKALGGNYPGHFESLINLFQHDDAAADLYENDGIHYNTKAKKLIANSVIQDLIQKKKLTVDKL